MRIGLDIYLNLYLGYVWDIVGHIFGIYLEYAFGMHLGIFRGASSYPHHMVCHVTSPYVQIDTQPYIYIYIYIHKPPLKGIGVRGPDL